MQRFSWWHPFARALELLNNDFLPGVSGSWYTYFCIVYSPIILHYFEFWLKMVPFAWNTPIWQKKFSVLLKLNLTLNLLKWHNTLEDPTIIAQNYQNWWRSFERCVVHMMSNPQMLVLRGKNPKHPAFFGGFVGGPKASLTSSSHPNMDSKYRGGGVRWGYFRSVMRYPPLEEQRVEEILPKMVSQKNTNIENNIRHND